MCYNQPNQCTKVFQQLEEFYGPSGNSDGNSVLLTHIILQNFQLDFSPSPNGKI